MTTKQFEANKVRRQILSEYEKWRDHLFDLPVILLLLNRLKEIVTLAKIKEAALQNGKAILPNGKMSRVAVNYWPAAGLSLRRRKPSVSCRHMSRLKNVLNCSRTSEV